MAVRLEGRAVQDGVGLHDVHVPSRRTIEMEDFPCQAAKVGRDVDRADVACGERRRACPCKHEIERGFEDSGSPWIVFLTVVHCFLPLNSFCYLCLVATSCLFRDFITFLFELAAVPFVLVSLLFALPVHLLVQRLLLPDFISVEHADNGYVLSAF